MMSCAPELIESQPKGSFAAYLRGVTKSALPLRFPLGHMEAMPEMSRAEFSELQAVMRKAYAVHYSEQGGANANSKPGPDTTAKAQEPPAKSDRTEPDTPDDRASPDW